MQTMASAAPAAPSMWPVMDLVELTMALAAASAPTACLMARVSGHHVEGGAGCRGRYTTRSPPRPWRRPWRALPPPASGRGR